MPPRKLPKIFSAEPLFEAAGVRSMHALARELGVSGTQVKRITVEGLTDVQADRYAAHLGMHPFEVWGPAWGQREAAR